jgi:hypothetical protein
MVSPSALLVPAPAGRLPLAVRPQDPDVARSLARADSIERALEPNNGIGNGSVQFVPLRGGVAVVLVH